MRAFLRRAAALCGKELRIILKDPRSRLVLVMPVILQSVLFGYVATFDLNRVDYALIDHDRSEASRELIRRFEGSGVFKRVALLENAHEIAPAIDTGRALLVLQVERHFASNLATGEGAHVQVLVDGRNANTGAIAAGYARTILEDFGARAVMQAANPQSVIRFEPRAWYNPNLETRWNIIAGLIASLAMLQTLLLTALSVAREKERGTLDQLLVTPLGPLAIMAGKAMPSIIVGAAQSTLVLLVGLFWFNIPFAGSYAFLYAVLLLFTLAVVGIGLCISVLVETMQQAMLCSFTLMVPMMLLSGLTTPVAAMPAPVRAAVLVCNPLRYGVEIVQRIYLEGAGPAMFTSDMLALGCMATVTLSAATVLFRKKLG